MFYCYNCRSDFREPGEEREIHFECDDCPSEEILVCPFCGDMDFEEVKTYEQNM